MPEPRENPRVETHHPVMHAGTTRDVAALIRTDRAFLSRIENDPELNQQDPTLVELKRIIYHRITELQSELMDEVSSTEDDLQVAYNCLFLSSDQDDNREVRFSVLPKR